MIPGVGDYVRIFLENSIQIEGFVHHWGKKIVLSTEDKKSFMVIKKIKKILMYKIVPIDCYNNFVDKSFEPAINDSCKTDYNQPFLFEDDSKNTDDSRYENFSDQQIVESVEQDDRIKKLADIFLLKKEEERKSMAQKISQDKISDLKQVKYESPGLYKK